MKTNFKKLRGVDVSEWVNLIIKTLILLSSTLLCGCYSHISYPDQARICYDGSKEPWNEQAIDLETPQGPVHVSYILLDVTNRDMHLYDDGSNYWVAFIVDTKRNVLVDYDPSKAFIETRMGKVHAEPRLYLHKPDDKLRPGSQTVKNLGDVPPGTYLYIKFPIKVPHPDEQWSLNFGSIAIADKKVPFPAYKLCKKEGKSYTYRYRGAF